MKFLVSLLVFFALASLARAAEFPAHWKFQTLHTPHFDIIVNAEQQEMGRFYAKKLEKAYALVTPLFTDVPDRVTVVLADKTDLTNGYATRLPYPHMFFFPVLAGPQESIGETGDWALELAIHELTHILTFEAVSGVMEPLQSVFGTILSPNLLLPTWWKEGVAVQTETQLSHGGRLRSAFQDGILRTLVDDGRLRRFDIATINERVPFWTEGMSAYLFGSLFWSEAVSEKGPETIDHLHQAHGGRIPYALGAPAEKHLGSGYEAFYGKALQETELRARKQIQSLKETPLVQGEDLRIQTHYSQGGRISGDGEHLAVIAIDETDRRAIRIFRRAPGREDFVSPVEDVRFVNRREEDILPAAPDAPPSGSISRLSWFPNEPRLVFDKVDWFSRYESYSDLWIFDVEEAKSRQLTHGLRAREPSVSRDGKAIHYVRLDGSRSSLARYDLETKTSTVLWRGQWQDRISFPVELGDGSIVFALRGEDGWEGLRRLRPGGGPPEVILDDFKDARFPEPTKDGLLFTSSQNGVHNLYLASEDFLTARPLTHVLGSIFSSGADPRTGDLYVTALTSGGNRVHKIGKEDSRALPQVLPTVPPLFGDRYPKADRAAADPEVPVEVSDYAPGSYLLPRYWIPFVGLSAVNNSLVIEASTAGFDPLKKHVYALSAGWDSGVREASYLATYQNNVLPHSLNFLGYRTASYLVSIDNPLFNEGASISVTPDVFRISRYFNVNVGLQSRKTSYGSARAERLGPSLLAQYVDYGKSGTQISPEEGGSLLGGTYHFLPGDGRLAYTQYLLSGQLFWSRWLPKRHALAFKVNSSYVREPLSSVYGVSTTNYFFVQDSPAPNYVVRGYRVGHFFGKTLTTANLEYRMPLRDLYSGSGTLPFYFLRVHGAAYADVVATDGQAYRPKEERFESVRSNRLFGSVGAEARLETTIGYLLPMNLVIGYSVPLSPSHSDGPGLTTALQLGAFF